MTESGTHLHFDPETDALYIDLRPRSDGDVYVTRQLDEGRLIDYDAEGNVLGVEFLWVSGGIELEGVPHAEAIREALRAVTSLTAA